MNAQATYPPFYYDLGNCNHNHTALIIKIVIIIVNVKYFSVQFKAIKFPSKIYQKWASKFNFYLFGFYCSGMDLCVNAGHESEKSWVHQNLGVTVFSKEMRRRENERISPANTQANLVVVLTCHFLCWNYACLVFWSDYNSNLPLILFGEEYCCDKTSFSLILILLVFQNLITAATNLASTDLRVVAREVWQDSEGQRR